MEELTREITRIRVYTSRSRVPYTTEVVEIDDEKAFLKTNHLPSKGEIITFDAYDANFTHKFSGTGKVSRIKDVENKNEKGFEISLIQ